MNDTTSATKPASPNDKSGTKIEFLQYHLPPVMAGNYSIEVTQKVGLKNPDQLIAFEGYELRMLRKEDDIPKEGKSLIVVTKVDADFRFRIFDRQGIKADKSAKDLADSPELSALRSRLEGFWENAKPSESEKHERIAFLSSLFTTFKTRHTFTVMGERYALNPQDVLAVFPPPGSNGDHANVLPHVILNRSTLPWEREPEKREKDSKASYLPLPWLAILLFDAEEAPKPKIMDLGDPKVKGANTLYGDDTVSFVKPELMSGEGGEHPDDRVTVIDVPSAVLEPLLPTDKDLPFLAHVRQWMTEEGKDASGERAVVIGNRLPKRGGAAIAHLVSLEHRYVDGKFWRDPDKTKKVRLVSLKNWRFQCLDEASYLITPSVLRKLEDSKILPKEKVDLLWDVKDGSKEVRPELRREFVGEQSFLTAVEALPDMALTDEEHKKEFLTAARYKKLCFKSLLMELDQETFHLPETALHSTDEQALRYLKHSYVPMSHRLRNGETTGSWYRGPLLSGPHQNVMLDAPVRAADHLLGYNKKLGMFDASYAAAWELGRLLMLQAKNVSLALFNWKRAHAHRLKGADHRLTHLPFNQLPAELETPASLRTWLYNTALLEGVPFNYLVPDPRMLPKESIRFFHLDKLWVECLLDGAFSIGRVISSDAERERTQHAEGDSPIRIAQHGVTGRGLPSIGRVISSDVERERTQYAESDSPIPQIAQHDATGRGVPEENVTGVLIRSEVVAGWPDLQVDGYAFLDLGDAKKEDTKLTLDDIVKELNGKTLSDHVWRSLDALGIGMPGKEDCRVVVTKKAGDGATGIGWDILDATGRDSSMLSVGEIKDLPGLADKLRKTQENTVSAYIKAHLCHQTLAYLANLNTAITDPEQLERTLVNDLNRIIRGHSLYSDQRFPDGPLPSPAPKGGALQRFNRRLLEHAYPDKISRKIERTLCQIDDENEKGTERRLAVKLPLLRIAHLSKNVLLCLFHGEIEAVDVHQKPEALHFGVSEPDPRHKSHHYKELRHPDGTEDAKHILEAIPLRDGKSDKPDAKDDEKTNRVLNIEALAKEIGLLLKDEDLTSADFALQMIEGVQKVRFTIAERSLARQHALSVRPEAESAPAVAQQETYAPAADTSLAVEAKAAPQRKRGKASRKDDLKMVEGIGPKIERIFHGAGITTFVQLAEAPTRRLNEILWKANLRNIADPGTWPEQAKLLAAGEMTAFTKLTKELKAGRRVK